MTTIDDQAEAMEALDREVCLKQRKPELPHIGVCHNCLEPIPAGTFCNYDCGQDWQKRSDFHRGEIP